MNPSPETGLVIPFRTRRRPDRRPQAIMPNVAAALRPGAPTDAEVNDEWDQLVRLASGAWSWRDPESLDALEQTVLRLRYWIEREWPE
jgi:hypothetical protein